MVFEEWLKTEQGSKCLNGNTQGQYLRNRLWWAFSAGQDSTKDEIKTDINKAASDIGDMFNKYFPPGGTTSQANTRQKAMKVYDKVCKYVRRLYEE